MALTATHVSLVLSGASLLREVDISLRAGEVTCVLGPNGAGKTTLLRVFAGDVRPDTGDVRLGEQPLTEIAARRRAMMLGVLPQHSVLNFPFTAREVVMLGRTPHSTGYRRNREIVNEALALVDGSYLGDRPYTRLSGGEKQRVHLARVLCQVWEPVDNAERFLLLDEPTSSFDLAHQQMTLDVVHQFAAQGVGVLMVVHDLNLAARSADNIVLMQCGAVVAAGTPEAVLQPATIADVFSVDVTIGQHPQTGKPLVIT